MRRVLLALFLCLLAVAPAFAAPAPRPFLDLDFEAANCTSPWFPFASGTFQQAVDSSVAWSGPQSLRIQYTGGVRWTSGRGYGLVSQAFPAADAAGRRLRVNVYIRTEDVRPGHAGLFLNATDSRGQVTFGQLGQAEGARGDTPWTLYQLEVDIPSDVRSITFGAVLSGGGKAWFDGLSIDLDGKRWQEGKAPSSTPPSRPALTWLRKQAIPFSTVEAGNGFADLQSLKKLIGKARIVSLGEATHGTKEFFQMKHRLLEFLVEEMGFTHFAIEANMPEANVMNDFVLHGEGDPREALEAMYFWTWNTQEVLDMALWMREYNASGKGPVQFLGFDAQYATRAAVSVENFLRRADPSYAVIADGILARAVSADRGGIATLDDVAAARSLVWHMESKQAEYEARFDPEKVKWWIQEARVILQVVEGVAGVRSRDESMADNVDWILRDGGPRAKVVLWAHNRHVAKEPGWMGRFLAERHGRNMVVMGFAFGEGRYNAYGNPGPLTAQDAPPPIPGSVESYLDAAGMPRFILDLRKVPNGSPAAGWLRSQRPHRNQGSSVLRCGYLPVSLASDYDAIIWMDQTSPSELLPFD